MASSDRPTEAQVRWLRSVKAGDVKIQWRFGGGRSYAAYGRSPAPDRGILNKLSENGWIEHRSKRIGDMSPSPVMLTEAGIKALERVHA